MPNLGFYLTESAEMHPHAAALRCEGVTTTYSELADSVCRFGEFLVHQGIRPGDRVGVMLPNRPEFVVVYYSVLHEGALVVPMNPLQSAREVEFFLSNTGAKMLLFAPECAAAATAGALAAGVRALAIDSEALAEYVARVAGFARPLPRADDDTAVILHTSGTTGVPKGAQLTHGNLCRNQAVVAGSLLKLEPDDVVMGSLPLFHVFGMTCGLLAATSAGATLALLPRFDPGEALRMIAAERITVFEGVPTMYVGMLAAAERNDVDVSSLRVCVSGGAAMPVEVLRAFENRFDCTVLEGYGLSETSPAVCFNRPNRVRKVGSIGTPIDGAEMRIVDDNGNKVPVATPGEIQVRGHNVMKGYWNRPDATEAAIKDGWFSTGDIGRVDEDGFYYVVDRKKDLIIRGGYNVYPREVEEALHEHPAVAAAVVIGLPHDLLGEEVGAAVVLKRDASADAVELCDFVKRRVAAYKYPRRIWIVDSLPTGPTGKVLRREVQPPPVEQT
ncbi:MAG: long-chain fatty acid--CoA ligase [Mycobacterium sp.]|uniref:long-chain-fatty-acid--CoA ligase n=1 Tax=Mycobacterium sp. TaxID=1785 RepID=UPI003C9E4FB7